PTITGSEPPDILQYRTRNPNFPNESTGDQFYDEAQWESYRRLGEYAADSAFAFLTKSPRRGQRSAGAVQEVDLRTALTGNATSGGSLSGAHLSDAHRSDARQLVAHAFSQARFEWLPKPPDFERRMERFVERAAEIDLEIAGGLRQSVLLHDADGDTPGHGELSAYLHDLVWLPHGRDLDAALLALRRALLFIEESYFAWDLEHTHGQPLSLGVMNYIGRWSGSPLLHVWWPLLKSLHSPPFIRFMERTFGFVGIQPADPDGSAADVVTETREPDTAGYATFLWQLTSQQQHAPSAAEGMTYVGYRLSMIYLGRRVYSVQAAMLRAVRSPGMLLWDASDFFVPPGLWGIGIGEDFLRRLRQRQTIDGAHHIVRLRRADGTDPAAAKHLADQLRMYRSAGFVEGAAGFDMRAAASDSTWLIRRSTSPHARESDSLPTPDPE
ncbi:MAG: hypothetical protein ACRELT_15225, partial [Longimicrobiales bacterium]